MKHIIHIFLNERTRFGELNELPEVTPVANKVAGLKPVLLLCFPR